jgi:hypothetical protein
VIDATIIADPRNPVKLFLDLAARVLIDA